MEDELFLISDRSPARWSYNDCEEILVIQEHEGVKQTVVLSVEQLERIAREAHEWAYGK